MDPTLGVSFDSVEKTKLGGPLYGAKELPAS